MLPFLFTLLGVAHPLPARTSFNETARRNRRPQVRIAPEERAMLRTWDRTTPVRSGGHGFWGAPGIDPT